ncbi:unnamed protein product [Parnassius apollo]|uniref:(apollo) hypothetical protein n=1 Tax=Parnassius apollo TaxID=110799 RepID=A0A8S3XG55_PARAO|nr:unnamed protein product [Parnassius apollo]
MASRSRMLVQLATGVKNNLSVQLSHSNSQIDILTQDENENAKSSTHALQTSKEDKDIAVNSIRPRSNLTSISDFSSSSSSSSSGPSMYQDSDDSVKDPDYEAQPTKHAEYSSDTAEEQNITTNYTNISDDHNLLTSNMVSINIENYEEPLSSTNEHAIVFNDPGVIENSELSAIENVSNENAASPIVYNSSPTKTGKKKKTK